MRSVLYRGYALRFFFQLFLDCSNFFVFQIYEFRFSENYFPVLIRSFPGSFVEMVIFIDSGISIFTGLEENELRKQISKLKYPYIGVTRLQCRGNGIEGKS